ncbi:hypothetical protein HYU13_01770, partial [Candidatus Woesearchaeota archaeon]|nr:hypothetical protein [Candidatus Woesearchaeota archaeon]
MPEQTAIQKEKVVLYTPTGRGEGYRLDSPTGQSIDKVTVQRWQTPGIREYRPNIEIELRQNPATTYTGGETRTEREFAQKQAEVMRKETEAAAPALYRVEAGGRVYETPSREFAERKAEELSRQRAELVGQRAVETFKRQGLDASYQEGQVVISQKTEPKKIISVSQQTKTQSKYTTEPKPPKGDLSETLRRKAEELEFNAQFREGKQSPLRRQAYSFMAVGASAVAAFLRPIYHPEQFVKETAKAIASPRETAKAIGEQARTTPAQLVGGIVGTTSFFKAISPALPSVRFEAVNIPSEPAFNIQVLTISKGSRAAIVAGTVDGKIFLGTPKLNLSRLPLREGVLVESPAATAIIRKNLPEVYSSLEVTKFEKALPIVRSTQATPSRFVVKQFVEEAKTLNPKGVREVISFARNIQEAEIYGSFAARQQMPGKLARTAADIDVQLPINQAQTNSLTQVLAKRLQSAGNEVRISPNNPSLIQAKIRGKWKNAVDVHSIEASLSELQSPAIAREKVYGLPLGQKPIFIQKVAVMPLSEQGIRKFGSAFTMREKGFAPEAHRIKDIPDFFAAQEVLIISKPIFLRPGLLARLESLKSLYAPEILQQGGEVRLPLIQPKGEPSTAKNLLSPSFYAGEKPSAKVSAFIKSPSASISPQPSKSLSVGRAIPSMRASPSMKSSLSVMAYLSIKPSTTSSSKSLSPRPSPIPSPSFSTKPSSSPNPSPSPSVSPRPSPSPSLSPSPSISPRPSRPFTSPKG